MQIVPAFEGFYARPFSNTWIISWYDEYDTYWGVERTPVPRGIPDTHEFVVFKDYDYPPNTGQSWRDRPRNMAVNVVKYVTFVTERK